MYIDDDEQIIEAQQQIFPHYGYKISAFIDPFDALSNFRSDPECYDAAIVDLVMPSMKGDQLAVELKKLNPNMPVIICTGYDSETAEQQVSELGLDGFLLKPIASKLMMETLSHIVVKQLELQRGNCKKY